MLCYICLEATPQAAAGSKACQTRHLHLSQEALLLQTHLRVLLLPVAIQDAGAAGAAADARHLCRAQTPQILFGQNTGITH